MNMKQHRVGLALGLFLAAGCEPLIINRADQAAYRVIDDRQRAALGTNSDVQLPQETGKLLANSTMYEFVPRPLPPGLPEEFETPEPKVENSEPVETSSAAPAGDADDADEEEDAISPSIFTDEQQAHVLTFRLSDALAFAMRHGREVQSAKEDVFLAALDLTLERHLWTPQFVGSVQTDYANYGQISDFDQAMSAVSELAVTQRLPYGGDVTARVINSLMRDLTNHVTTGEPGNLILEANLPLLRGAGRAAYETRYQAERELIYAVRTFENFRRSFSVRVAADYFDLQLRKAAIGNAYKSYRSRREDWIKAEFENQVGRSRNVFDVSRAQSTFRNAEATLVSTKELYASGLDRFKILLGMPVERLLDVVNQEDDQETSAFESLVPRVDEATAVSVALRQRLDLLNDADAVDDSQRGVAVARNRILPDLNLSGGATLDTDPDHLSSTSYNTERTTWRAAAELRMDDRKTERTAYRASLVAFRRAQRDFEQAEDTVRADVRRAIRRIEQQSNLLAIQTLNVNENEMRAEAARAQYDLGKIGNRDVVDADEALLEARNRYAAAVSEYRIALLEFRRDTGTLRVDDDGHWHGLSAADPAKMNGTP